MILPNCLYRSDNGASSLEVRSFLKVSTFIAKDDVFILRLYRYECLKTSKIFIYVRAIRKFRNTIDLAADPSGRAV